MIETSFRSPCKMAFLAPRTGYNTSCSCPFDLVPTRIDSAECPLQNTVLGSQYIFDPKLLQNDRFLSKKGSSNAQKRSEAHQNSPKMNPKRCQNDPQVTPKWTRIDPKMVQNHPKITLFWPKKRSKKCQQRPLKRPQKVPKMVKHCPETRWACSIVSKSTRNPLTVPPGTYRFNTDRFL